jgi:hypothetical protein
MWLSNKICQTQIKSLKQLRFLFSSRRTVHNMHTLTSLGLSQGLHLTLFPQINRDEANVAKTES